MIGKMFKGSKIHPIQPQPTQPQPTVQSPIKTLLIYVFGIGCGFQSNDDITKIRDKDLAHYRKIFNNNNIELEIFYNNSLIKMFCDAGSMICIKKEPNNNADIVTKVYDFVSNKVDNYKNINVFGHSYGGSIVSRLAEKLNKDDNKLNDKHKTILDKIEMYTFGSIYIPKAEINRLSHFLFSVDVALKINDLKPTNKPQRKDIIWLKKEVNDTNQNSRLIDKIIGTDVEWRNHNSYMFLITILITCSTDLGNRGVEYLYGENKDQITLKKMYDRLGLECYQNNINSPSETHS